MKYVSKCFIKVVQGATNWQKYPIVSGQNLEIQAIVNQSKAASAIGASATKAAEQAPSNAGQKVRRLLHYKIFIFISMNQ